MIATIIGRALCLLGRHKPGLLSEGATFFKDSSYDHPRAFLGLCVRCDKLFVKRLTDADAARLKEGG